MKVLHIDTNHPILIDQLQKIGIENDIDTESNKSIIEEKIAQYQGIVIRSRFPIDKQFMDRATQLRFIARVGAGLENIDVGYAKLKGIELIAAPEGNRNAVAEHALGMLLSLFNKLQKGHREIQKGNWLREAHRGIELNGKTIGIIGYGNTGKAFAKKLSGFDVTVYCVDILNNIGDENAIQVPLHVLQEKSDVISLHTPQTPETLSLIDESFIKACGRPFWLLNTARGKSVSSEALVKGLKSGAVLGAGLDVLEYEKSSFESLFENNEMPQAFAYLLEAENVLLSPHVAGWTVESKKQLAETIVHKIKRIL